MLLCAVHYYTTDKQTWFHIVPLSGNITGFVVGYSSEQTSPIMCKNQSIFVKTTGETLQINTNKLGIIVPVMCISMTLLVCSFKSIMERDFYVIIVRSDRCAAPGASQSPYKPSAYEYKDKILVSGDYQFPFADKVTVVWWWQYHSVRCCAVTDVMTLRGMKTGAFYGLNKHFWKNYTLVFAQNCGVHACLNACRHYSKWET